MDELSCVPETQQSQQADRMEELVVGLEDPPEMSDTEQGDFGLETQHDSESSDEDTQKGKGKGNTDKRSKKPDVLFSVEEEQKLVDFLRDNEILYNKRLMDYKDRSNIEAVWDKFCENNLHKDACQRWFQSQHILFEKVTDMKPGQVEALLTDRQKWTRDNSYSSGTTSCAILQQKVNSGLPRGLLLKPVQQRAHHPDGRLCTQNRSRILLFQSQLMTHETSRTWKHIHLLLDRVLSV